ncbi:hypothetical protein AURDEDRAFT_168386 [Auricularia subglabra TFB-10046 SS5]|nr:hypothetical protein AURDEDRAFT_168386 [Auricularia subglabra TFB-10046 SS5]
MVVLVVLFAGESPLTVACAGGEPPLLAGVVSLCIWWTRRQKHKQADAVINAAPFKMEAKSDRTAALSSILQRRLDKLKPSNASVRSPSSSVRDTRPVALQAGALAPVEEGDGFSESSTLYEGYARQPKRV